MGENVIIIIFYFLFFIFFENGENVIYHSNKLANKNYLNSKTLGEGP